MSLRIIEGSRGAGKTCLATHHAYKAYRRGRNVFANYHLEFEYEPITSQTFSTKKGRKALEDCVILVDEAHNIWGARTFMSTSNRIGGLLQRQLRKRGCDLILTSQQAIAIDIDFRRNLDVMDECFPYHLDKKQGGYRKATLWEIENQQIDLVMVKETLYWAETSSQPAPTSWIKFDPKPYFKLYDSNEFVDFGEEDE